MAAANVAVSETLSEFSVHAPLELRGSGPYYQISLPLDVTFASHFTDLRDLRVFNAQGETMPFSLTHGQSRTEQALQKTNLTWFPLYSSAEPTSGDMPEIRVTRNAEGTVVSVTKANEKEVKGKKLRGYLLDASQSKNAFQTLELDWDSNVSGFQQLSIEASDDLKNWHTWQDAARLARFEYNGQHIERKDIELTGQHANYLRLQWRDIDQAPPLKSAVLTTSSSTYQSAPFLWSTPFAPSHSDNDEYEYQLARLVPAERIRIAIPQINALAPVEIWGKGDANGSWYRITQTVLYRLQAGGKEWQQPDIQLSAQPVRYLKLKVDKRSGGLGQGVPTLSIGLTSRQLVFLGRGQAPFVLAVGSDAAKSANLPITTLIPGYGTDNSPLVSGAELGMLGSSSSTGGEVPISKKSGIFDNVNWNTVILWIILLTGVTALGVMAARLSRKTQ